MSRSISDIVVHIVLMGLAGYFLIESFAIRGSAAGGSLPPAFFPKTVCMLLLVFLALSLINEVREMIREKGEENFILSRETLVSTVGWVAVLFLLIVYTLLLEKLGYIIATSFLIFLVVAVLVILSKKGERNISASNTARLAAFSLVVSVSIFFVFSKGFGIRLPVMGMMGV